MSQSQLYRLLVVPAIVLAAALPLTACSTPSSSGSDSDSSSNSSSNDDDADEEDDSSDASGGCSQEFLDKTKESAAGGSQGETLSVSNLDPSAFQPAELGQILDGSCVYVIEYVEDGVDGQIFGAYVAGGAAVVEKLDATLLDAGYTKSEGGLYVASDNSYVTIFENDGTLSQEQIDAMGLTGYGEDIIGIMAAAVPN